MTRLPRTIALALTLTALAAAQSTATAPPAPPTPKPPTVSLAAENALLKAEHDLDQVVSQEAQLQLQFQQLQKAYQDAEAKRPALTKAVADATAAGQKECGDAATFDPANFVCVPKDKGKDKAAAAAPAK